MTDKQTLVITLTLVILSYVMLIVFLGLLTYYCVAIRKQKAARRRRAEVTGEDTPSTVGGDTAEATPVKDDQRSTLSNGHANSRLVAEVLPVVAVCVEQPAEKADDKEAGVTSPVPPELPPRPASYFEETPTEEAKKPVSRGSVMERVSLYETIERRLSSNAAEAPPNDITPYEDLATLKRKLRMTAEHDEVWQDDGGTGGGGTGDGGTGDNGGSTTRDPSAEPIYSKPEPKRKDAGHSTPPPPPGDQSVVEPTTPAVPPKNEAFSFPMDDSNTVDSY